MSLRPLQAIRPFGQFDGYDTEITLSAGGFQGGEVATLVAVTLGDDNDFAAKDADGSDGYVGLTPQTRPVVTRNLTSGDRPLFLTDDGSNGYGTLFGEVVGSTAGKVVPSPGAGTQLGPHTADGSGKVTLWNYHGTYAISLTAVDATDGEGLLIDNAAVTVGAGVYATTTGLLTSDNSTSKFEDIVLGRFVEFSTNGSLVTTPLNLADASATADFTEAVIFWGPEL